MNCQLRHGIHALPFCAVCLLVFPGWTPVFAGEAILEDSSLRAAFSPDSGALIRLENKLSRWKIERRSELGASFRLHARLPGHRDNFVFGPKQHATHAQLLSDHQLRLEWKGLLSERDGVLPMTLT